jgi:tetratricopeptide (TPR) repeat protein
MYQLRKLVGRHRAGVAFAGAIVLFAVGWAITASVLLQRQREARLAAEDARTAAETEARKAERIQGFLRDMLTSVDPAQAQGRDVTVREVLDRAAADAEEALAEEPEVRAEIRLTLGMAYQSLGLYDEAEPHLQASLAERRSLFGERHLLTAASVRQLAWLKQQGGIWRRRSRCSSWRWTSTASCCPRTTRGSSPRAATWRRCRCAGAAWTRRSPSTATSCVRCATLRSRTPRSWSRR